jgi:hypothetical protein
MSRKAAGRNTTGEARPCQPGVARLGPTTDGPDALWPRCHLGIRSDMMVASRRPRTPRVVRSRRITREHSIARNGGYLRGCAGSLLDSSLAFTNCGTHTYAHNVVDSPGAAASNDDSDSDHSRVTATCRHDRHALCVAEDSCTHAAIVTYRHGYGACYVNSRASTDSSHQANRLAAGSRGLRRGWRHD